MAQIFSGVGTGRPAASPHGGRHGRRPSFAEVCVLSDSGHSKPNRKHRREEKEEASSTRVFLQSEKAQRDVATRGGGTTLR